MGNGAWVWVALGLAWMTTAGLCVGVMGLRPALTSASLGLIPLLIGVMKMRR